MGKMPESQIRVLKYLASNTGRTAFATELIPTLYRLERKGLVEAKPDRLSMVGYTITDAGRRALTQEEER